MARSGTWQGNRRGRKGLPPLGTGRKGLTEFTHFLQCRRGLTHEILGGGRGLGSFRTAKRGKGRKQ